MEVERLHETMTLKVHFITSLSLSLTSFSVTSFSITCLRVTCWTAPPKQCILARGAKHTISAEVDHSQQTSNSLEVVTWCCLNGSLLSWECSSAPFIICGRYIAWLEISRQTLGSMWWLTYGIWNSMTWRQNLHQTCRNHFETSMRT